MVFTMWLGIVVANVASVSRHHHVIAIMYIGFYPSLVNNVTSLVLDSSPYKVSPACSMCLGDYRNPHQVSIDQVYVSWRSKLEKSSLAQHG